MQIDKLAWLFVQNRKVLFLRSKGKTQFFTPGGKREGKESDQEALIREIREELSVDLVPETISYITTFSAQAAGHPEGVFVESKCYAAEYRGTLAPSSEIEELRWFTSADTEGLTPMGVLILAFLKERGLID